MLHKPIQIPGVRGGLCNPKLKFEDGLRTGVLPGGYGGRTFHRINSKPPGIAGWSWVGSHFCRVPRMVDIKVQLCGVRIELAVRSLRYPRQSGAPGPTKPKPNQFRF